MFQFSFFLQEGYRHSFITHAFNYLVIIEGIRGLEAIAKNAVSKIKTNEIFLRRYLLKGKFLFLINNSRSIIHSLVLFTIIFNSSLFLLVEKKDMYNYSFNSLNENEAMSYILENYSNSTRLFFPALYRIPSVLFNTSMYIPISDLMNETKTYNVRISKMDGFYNFTDYDFRDIVVDGDLILWLNHSYFLNLFLNPENLDDPVFQKRFTGNYVDYQGIKYDFIIYEVVKT